MTSKVFQIALNVKTTRSQIVKLAASGWKWFVIRPDGIIHSKHRKEDNTRNNINDYMRQQGFRVWRAA
jgi:very-short-patch-repair endonuclease